MQIIKRQPIFDFRFSISEIDWSLYAIIDHAFLNDRSAAMLAEQLVEGGAGVIQLRNKTGNIKVFYEQACGVIAVTRRFNIPLIINDRLDVAMAVGADGVHVGQEDLPVSVVREIWKQEKIVGVSVHDMNEFESAETENPDYFGVGTIYPTNTKSNLETTGTEILSQIRKKTKKPLVAIGGISIDSMAPVFQSGADGVAVISALLQAEDIKSEALQFKKRISEFKAS